ncbi:transaldolase [Actinopolyspora lacussalsi]|nr:transaldolase [Actinopolyspora lacussalsi]
MRTIDPLTQLGNEGVSRWLTDLGSEGSDESLRHSVRAGEVTGAVHGPESLLERVTSNRRHRKQLSELRAHEITPAAAVTELLATDARRACSILRPVYEQSRARDGYVTISVDPRWGNDMVDAAITLWHSVDQPNLLVRLPPTEDGFGAITELLARGIGVDSGPVITLEQHDAVTDGWLAGLVRAHEAGRDLSRLLAVVSVPIEPVGSECVRELDAASSTRHPRLGSEVALAKARLLFRNHEERLTDRRWRELADLGAQPQRIRWTHLEPATFLSENEYRYVEELVVWDAIASMRRRTLRRFAERGMPRGDAVTDTQREAERVFDSLESLGVNHEAVNEAVCDRLTHDHVSTWDELYETARHGVGT